MENSWWSIITAFQNVFTFSLDRLAFGRSWYLSSIDVQCRLFFELSFPYLFLCFSSFQYFSIDFGSVSMYYHSVLWLLSHYYKDPYTRSSKSHVRVLNTAQLWMFKSTFHRFFQVFWRGALQSGEGQCRYRCDPTEGGIELMAWWPFFTCWGMVFLQDGPPLL